MLPASAFNRQQQVHQGRKKPDLRIERGNAALLNGKTEQAFDADELRFKLEDQLYSHGLRYGSDDMV